MERGIKGEFYPALGTPTGLNGELVKESFGRHIEMMIGSGASGLLCMGSMGKMESIKNSEYPKVAQKCVEIAAGRIPVMAGVMDCSVGRVLDRIAALNGVKIDGVVATAPYYCRVDADGIINFFKKLSEESKYPVYIYDLPSVTQSPITFRIMEAVEKMPNIRGIKTANISLISELVRNGKFEKNFSFYCSNLDLFDVAICSGIGKNLDGMFSCTPHNAKMMYGTDDRETISEHLNNILALRNLLIKENVFSSFSYAMELLGCPGDYGPDYAPAISDGLKGEISRLMKRLGEI